MYRVVSFLVLAALAVAPAACKQGEGEYCQISDDCTGGLVCNQLTHTCLANASSTNDGGIDAAIDASDGDADGDAPIDADIDAPIDADIDAPIDAGLD